MVSTARRRPWRRRQATPPARRRGQRGRRRAVLNASGFALVGALALGAAAAAIANTQVPSPVAGAPTISGGTGAGLDITWVGDTFLGGGAQPFIDRNGSGWPGSLLPAISPDHVVIANLEGPMTERTEPFDPMQRWSYNSDPATSQGLVAMGIDTVSLANNHAMDRGPEGLQDTLMNAESVGLRAFGAGSTSSEARLPLLIESEGAVVAVLGFSDDGGIKTATNDRPGVRRLSLPNLQADIEAARAAGVDRVIAAVHWGGNYTSLDPRQETWADAFAEAGYDMVVGTGPHVPQPIDVVDGMPVVYSLGNYVFGTPGRFNDEAEGFGLVVTTSLTDANEVTLTARCIQTDNDVVSYQPRPCDPQQTTAVMAGVNPSLVVSGDRATMTLALPQPPN